MKLKHLIPQRYRQQVIRQFGEAKLVRWYDRQWRCHHHELIGGTDADCRDALLWASLFAHDITFGPATIRAARSAGPARTRTPERRPSTDCARTGVVGSPTGHRKQKALYESN